MKDTCADRESPYLSLYIVYHTPESFVISKLKDDKPFMYCKRLYITLLMHSRQEAVEI